MIDMNDRRDRNIVLGIGIVYLLCKLRPRTLLMLVGGLWLLLSILPSHVDTALTEQPIPDDVAVVVAPPVARLPMISDKPPSLPPGVVADFAGAGELNRAAADITWSAQQAK